MRFLVIGGIIVMVGAFGIYYISLPKVTQPPQTPANGGIIPALGQSLLGLGKQATIGPLAQKLSPILNQPKVPASPAGVPVATNPWAALAATAPSLFTGVTAIVTQEQKNSAANDAALQAQDLLLLQQAGGVPANGKPAVQPGMVNNTNLNSANPAVSNPLSTAVVNLPAQPGSLDTATVNFPPSQGDISSADVSNYEVPLDTPIDSYDYQVPEFDPLT